MRLTNWIAAAALLAPAALAQDVTLRVTGGDETGAISARLSGASTLVALHEDGASDPRDFIAAARADYRRMLLGLYTLGYYGGSVSITADGREVSQIPPLNAPAALREVVISVDPGPGFTFGTTQVAPVPAGTGMPDGFAPGQPALSRLVGEAAQAGVDAWRADGHAKAAIAGQQITAHHPQRQLDARVQLAPGPRLRFGPLVVTGNSATRTDRILAIAGLPQGAIYSPAALEAAADRLRRTGTFRSVSFVEADSPTADLHLPIEARISERLPRRLGAGLEYSSSEGLTASAYWLHRNLLGGAENLRLDGVISQIGGAGTDYGFSARFTRPATFGTLNTLTATADLALTHDPGYSLRSARLGVGLTRSISDDLTASLGVGLVDARVEDALGLRHYRQLTLPLAATLERRDVPRNAKRGYYLNLDATPFLGLSGSASGVRLYADARAYRSFGDDDRVTLAGRVQMGSLLGPEARYAPADYLFFAGGGGGSVRGHDYQSLGIPAPGGAGQIGGRSLAAASLEARVQVRDKIGLVGFYDIAHIGPDPMPGQGGSFIHGAGLGVRYDTSLGPIRLDVAVPLRDDLAWRDVHFYIGIGQSF